MKPLWSFSSGSEIYSSYQAPVDQDKENESGAGSDYYIDLGDDWELYAHSRLGKLVRCYYRNANMLFGHKSLIILGQV